MRKVAICVSVLALVVGTPVFAASGSSTGNGTSTLAGPAGKGKMKSHSKMKKSHKKM